MEGEGAPCWWILATPAQPLILKPRPFPQEKFDTLVSDHQRSMEELKVTLSGGPAAGQEPDGQELRATLEALKMEHQLEMENLKAKHKIEAALLTKEREDLSSRLQELKDPAWRPEPEVGGKLEEVELRAAELQRKLEEKTADYQALQEARRENQEEVQKLEEKLRVTSNQLQAAQAARYCSTDANVRDRPIGTRRQGPSRPPNLRLSSRSSRTTRSPRRR